MAGNDNSNNLAVLIDADNVSSRVIAGVMAEVASYGTASVRRIYGDWTSPSMKSWRECLLEHSLIPIQQFAYTTGKNATDGAMIIDAMDLLYTGRFSSFCLVSSDSDFTRLAARIREQGITVYGFGNRRTTNHALVAACNKFVYFDSLADSEEESRPPQAPPGPASPNGWVPRSPQNAIPTAPRAFAHFADQLGSVPPFQHSAPSSGRRVLDGAALSAIAQAISTSNPIEDDWVHLGAVGDKLPRISPDLVPRNYGYERLKDFIAASGIVELWMKPMGSHSPVALVRLTDAPSTSSDETTQSASQS